MNINLDEIFDTTSFTIDREPHIVVDSEACTACDNRACTTCCPARCYSWDEESQKLTFVHDGCLECGTCYVVCRKQAFSRWRYPRGGFGVSFRLT